MSEKNLESENEKNNFMRKEFNHPKEIEQQQIFYPEAKEYPAILQLICEKHQITATLSDGRIISIPTAWFSRLRKATESQLKNFEVADDGYDIHWPEIDEDISIKAFINGLQKF